MKRNVFVDIFTSYWGNTENSEDSQNKFTETRTQIVVQKRIACGIRLQCRTQNNSEVQDYRQVFDHTMLWLIGWLTNFFTAGIFLGWKLKFKSAFWYDLT